MWLTMSSGGRGEYIGGMYLDWEGNSERISWEFHTRLDCLFKTHRLVGNYVTLTERSDGFGSD